MVDQLMAIVKVRLDIQNVPSTVFVRKLDSFSLSIRQTVDLRKTMLNI